MIFDGVGDLDAFGPFEVLVNAARAGAEVEVRLVTLERAGEVRTSHGATVRPDGVLDDFGIDILIVPGGGWNDRAPQGAWAQAQDGRLPDAIRRLHEGGAVVASVCTGGGIVAASGLLDGRPAITHRAAVEELRERGVEVVDARVVDDGDVVSAGGVTAGIDLALWLVERHWGTPLADHLAVGIEYERRGPVHHGPSSGCAATDR